MRTPLRFLGLVLGALTGCDPLDPPDEMRICHVAGCPNLARLEVLAASGQPLAHFHGVATLESGTRLHYSCPGFMPSVSCDGNQVLLETYEPVVAVTIVSDLAAESTDLDLRPRLQEFFPNGEDCEPVCRSSDSVATLVPTP